MMRLVMDGGRNVESLGKAWARVKSDLFGIMRGWGSRGYGLIG